MLGALLDANKCLLKKYINNFPSLLKKLSEAERELPSSTCAWQDPPTLPYIYSPTLASLPTVSACRIVSFMPSFSFGADITELTISVSPHFLNSHIFMDPGFPHLFLSIIQENLTEKKMWKPRIHEDMGIQEVRRDRYREFCDICPK